MEFKDFSRTPPKIQELFKTVRTLFLQVAMKSGKLNVCSGVSGYFRKSFYASFDALLQIYVSVVIL